MLESYIAPLFTGYVEKYIKNLKPEDLSLSLWGGDLVLQNLEINLDVLQQVCFIFTLVQSFYHADTFNSNALRNTHNKHLSHKQPFKHTHTHLHVHIHRL